MRGTGQLLFAVAIVAVLAAGCVAGPSKVTIGNVQKYEASGCVWTVIISTDNSFQVELAGDWSSLGQSAGKIFNFHDAGPGCRGVVVKDWWLT